LKVNPKVDTHHPRSPHKPPPGACRVLDPTVAFGSDWTQFRSAAYNRVPPPSGPRSPGTGAKPQRSKRAQRCTPSITTSRSANLISRLSHSNTPAA
jgi:hypothetical protein